MEMLNNVWNVLCTENVGIVNLLLFPCAVIESIMILMLFTNILNIESLSNKKLIYIILSSICSILTTLFIPSPFNVICNYLIVFFLIFFIFRQNLLKSIVALLLPSVIFALVNLSIVKIYIRLLNITYEQAESIPIYRLTYLLIVYAVVFLVISVLKHRHLKITILDDFDKNTNLMLIINFVFGILAIAVQSILVVYYINKVPTYISILSFATLIFYFIINLYSLSRITKLTLTTRELETVEAYNKSITVLYDNVKGFKHDFDNIVSAIGGYVETNDMDGLKEYYHSLRDDCQKTNNIATLNPDIINNPAIYSILCSKYHKADSLGIKINLEFFVDLNEFDIKSYEFSRILGILLDNAIEASSECEEKIININFRSEYNKNRNVVIISNTYKDKNVDTEEIFEKGKSGKENHSGLGLWEVRQYMKKNNNLNLYTTKNDKYFTQQLEIYNNKK